MTRKSESGSATSPDRANPNLKKLRDQIDTIDRDIVKLVNKRASIASQIGKLKAESGGVIFDAHRETEVFQNVLEANHVPLLEPTIRAIFGELISGCRSLQREQRVAFLGPEYSYSHLAAIERFGASASYFRVGSIAAVFEEVIRKHADFGLVPLFNSTDGRIADTLDSFIQQPEVKICAEVRLRVRHNLIAKCEQPDIRRVYSKAQALSQCRNWLSKNLPHATLHEVSSTADAARLVQSEPNAAAVASKQAAAKYGLQVLVPNIEDQAENETRFAVIALQDSGKTGADKTAMMFQVPNRPGALANVLTIFAQNKINLTWIESFPYKAAKGEYVFFVDFDGHAEDPKVKKVIKALEDECDELSILGSFPAAPPIPEKE